ncbi:MAG: VIT family protein [Actinobacteria bacterium]|nr:VIT family protein [Actinomycetota bacterium]
MALIRRHHRERHRFRRIGWLRAAVLGANDGIVSTASILIGVTAASAGRTAIIVAGLAALVGGALSMAAGEYVSVSSQRDTERADIARERGELSRSPGLELDELTDIYVKRGLDRDLAHEVAVQLTAVDPLGAHLRDELGMHESTRARPLQAAFVSAASFAAGAVIPLAVAAAAPADGRLAVIAGAALVLLAVTGAVSGRLGGAPAPRAAARVLAGGGIAMGAAALIGELVGTQI